MTKESIPQIGALPQPVAKEHRPALERTASGILVPEGTIDRVIQGSRAKAEQAAAPRMSRREIRAMGNKRVVCKRCKTPVKLKNFAAHAVRLHPESDTAKQEAADPQAHVHP